MKFRESALAHRLLDGLEGLEIGGSAHNSFGLNTRNVDLTKEMTVFKKEEIRVCGEALPVDIAASGDQLPLDDSSVDFVISSHVMEHFPDPIKALKEWHRVVRPGGYIYVIAPHKDRTFDKDRERTPLADLIERHESGICPNPNAAHCSVWITEDFVELIEWLGWPIVAVQDSDDKVGNGFAVVTRVEKGESERAAQSAAPAITVKQPDKHNFSITFLLGPTGNTRTGGAACILEYARRFQERGHPVSLTTWPRFLWPGPEPFPNLDFSVPIHFDRTAKPDSLPYHLVNQSPRDYLGELKFFTSYLSLLTPAIPRADVIIAANWESVLPAWQCGKGKAVHFPQHYDEVFFTLDGAATSASLQGNPLIKMLCRNAFQMPVYRIANSSWLAGELKRRFGEQVPVVTHGIDTKRFRELPKLSEKDEIIRIVTYSRPDKWKGFQDAVPAIGEVMKRHPGKIEWHVYGFAHGIRPDNQVAPYKFHGPLGHEELSRLYAESDIVLCPSWYESFPLPPIEAMACGTAVITTRYGTEDYAIDGHTAIVVRPRVVADFVTALDGLVRRPDIRRRLARNGRAMAESLTWEGAVAAREELLWRIYRNRMPTNAFQGLETGIADGYGKSFERLIAEVNASDGDLLNGADGEHYLVESGRLRHLKNPEAIGADLSRARPVDLLTLWRNEHGPEITSAANYYGFRS